MLGHNEATNFGIDRGNLPMCVELKTLKDFSKCVIPADLGQWCIMRCIACKIVDLAQPKAGMVVVYRGPTLI